MRNVFLFIRRYFNLVLFLILQAIALIMLFRYNKFHQAAFLEVANEVTGNVTGRFNNIETYFSLKNENEKLRAQNAALLNKLRQDFAWPDSTVMVVTDSVSVDTLEQYRRFLYLPVKVISNTVSSQNNYLTLHRGSGQGVSPNMAVVGPEGVVGTVVNVSNNMAVVMSMLHRQSRIVAMLKKGSGFGEVTWDGKDPHFVTLSKIPKTDTVMQGDSVVTSPFSDKYPPGHLIGIVVDIQDDKSTGTYIMKLRTATNFYNVQHAYIVRNLQQFEKEALEKTIKRGE
jgi:rod shape-determining protein MreC